MVEDGNAGAGANPRAAAGETQNPKTRMNDDERGGDDFIHSNEFLHHMMRRQLRLSIGCGLAFATVLLAVPLLNYAAPEAMAARVGGFTLTWLILGVLFFPFVWLISWIFIKRSLAMEAEEARRAEEAAGRRA